MEEFKERLRNLLLSETLSIFGVTAVYEEILKMGMDLYLEGFHDGRS